MLFFATPAFAQAGGAPGTFWSFAPLIILFVIFYFLLIRPQQKRAKEHREMLSKVQVGDAVVTTGGIYGRVTSLAEDTVMVEVAEKVRIKVARDAIASRKPQG